MKINRVVLRQIQMPLVHFFETSFGRTEKRDIVLVEAQGEGMSGWGEVTAGENPFYNEEWTESAWLVLRDYVAPQVMDREIAAPEAVAPLTAISAATRWRAAVWKQRCGICGAARRRPAVEENWRRRAARDPLRRVPRHSRYGRALLERIEANWQMATSASSSRSSRVGTWT